MHLEMSFLYVSIHLGVLDFFHKSRILGRFSKYNMSTMTTARADLKTELTNKRATNCAPQVGFSPFYAFHVLIRDCVVFAEGSLTAQIWLFATPRYLASFL